MANAKGKIKVKVEANKKAVKPKLGKGTGGLFTAKILAHVKAKKESNKSSNK